jgi:hypothetical protein
MDQLTILYYICLDVATGVQSGDPAAIVVAIYAVSGLAVFAHALTTKGV